jgi:single-strand DNA-binding protein
MNNWTGSGRLTRDVELRIGDNGNGIAKFGIAVDRAVKRGDKWEHEADFINCVAFGKTAEFVERYFHKGDFIIILGNLKTGNYTNKDGVKVYTTDVIVEKAEFGGSKSNNETQSGEQKPAPSQDKFLSIPDTDLEELPFS